MQGLLNLTYERCYVILFNGIGLLFTHYFFRICQQSLSLLRRQRKKCGEDLAAGDIVTASLKVEIAGLSTKLSGILKRNVFDIVLSLQCFNLPF